MTTTLASTVLGVMAIPLISVLGQGDKAKGYMLTALTVGILGAVFYIIGFANIREHVQPVPNQKITLRSSVKAIVQNKPLLLLLSCGLIGNIGTMLKQGMVIYYVKDCIGSESLIPIFSLLFLPGMVVGLMIAPAFAKRFDSKSVFIGAKVFGITVDVIFFFVGFGNVPLAMVLYALTSYVPNQVTSETQNMIHGAFTLFAAVLGVVSVVPMLFNRFTDKEHKKIVMELEERRRQAET